MSKTPNYDAKVKEILDATTTGERACSVTGEKWEMTEKELDLCRSFNVPPSDMSQISRQRYMTLHFNTGQWWYNKHAETGKPVLSSSHPASGVRVLPDREWFEKDFAEVGQEYNSEKPMFEQLRELRLVVPESASKDYVETENSMSLASFGDVNSFFMTASRSKGSFHGAVALDVEDSSEIYSCKNVTSSYNIIHSDRIHKSQYVRECRDVIESAFVFDCRNCEFCFGATNKRNKKYIWFNDELSQEEWERRRAKVDLGVRSVAKEYLEKFDQLVKDSVWPENFNEKSENSTGEYLTGATNCEYVYYSDGGARDIFWSGWAFGKTENCAFCANAGHGSDVWNCVASTFGASNKFCSWTARCYNLEYCMSCYDCEFCFACIGLTKKKYHILNKEYSEEDYWKKVDEIKCRMLDSGEYGNFLPPKLGTSWFHESGSIKYLLTDLEFGKKADAHLFDPEEEGAYGDEFIGGAEVPDSTTLPDSIDDCDEWAGKPVVDSSYGRRFAMLKPEVALYKKLRIAPSMTHPVQRVTDLIWTANSGVFVDAKCEKCDKDVITSMNKTYPEKRIYCQECYLQYLETNG